MLIPSYLTAAVLSGFVHSKPITYAFVNAGEQVPVHADGTQSKFPAVAVVEHAVAACDCKIIGIAGVLTTILTLSLSAVEMSHEMSAPKTFEPK